MKEEGGIFNSMTPEALFQQTKDLSEHEKQDVIKGFLTTADEDDFTRQMLVWGDEIVGGMEELRKEIDEYRKSTRVC